MGSASSSSRYCSTRACCGLPASGISATTCSAGHSAGLGRGWRAQSWASRPPDSEASLWHHSPQPQHPGTTNYPAVWGPLPFLDFPGDASGKEPAWGCRRYKRCWFNPWIGKIPWRRAWQPTPVFCMENPMDRETWRAIVDRVAKSWTQLKLLACTHTSPYRALTLRVYYLGNLTMHHNRQM